MKKGISFEAALANCWEVLAGYLAIECLELKGAFIEKRHAFLALGLLLILGNLISAQSQCINTRYEIAPTVSNVEVSLIANNCTILVGTGAFNITIKDTIGNNTNILLNGSNYNIKVQNVRLENITGRPAIQINPGSYNVTIDKVNIKNVTGANADGIFLSGTSASPIRNVTINNSNISLTARWGVCFIYSSHNQMINSSASGREYGIYLDYSSHNTIINSNASADRYYGIYLSSSSHNQIINTTAIGVIDESEDSSGIVLHSSSNNTIINSSASGVAHGISLYSSSNNTIINSSAIGGIGIFLCESSNNNQIINSIATGGFDGITFCYSSNNNTIINSFASGNYGISLENSLNNTIINSTAIGNVRSIILYSSINNVLLNTSFNRSKIYVDSSSNVTIQWYLDVPIRYPNGTIITGLNRSIVNIERPDWANITTNETTSIVTEAIVSAAPGYVNWRDYAAYKANISVIGFGPNWNATKKIVLNESKSITLTGAGDVTQDITLENDLSCTDTCFNVINKSIILNLTGVNISSDTYAINITANYTRIIGTPTGSQGSILIGTDNIVFSPEITGPGYGLGIDASKVNNTLIGITAAPLIWDAVEDPIAFNISAGYMSPPVERGPGLRIIAGARRCRYDITQNLMLSYDVCEEPQESGPTYLFFHVYAPSTGEGWQLFIPANSILLLYINERYLPVALPEMNFTTYFDGETMAGDFVIKNHKGEKIYSIHTSEFEMWLSVADDGSTYYGGELVATRFGHLIENFDIGIILKNGLARDLTIKNANVLLGNNATLKLGKTLYNSTINVIGNNAYIGDGIAYNSSIIVSPNSKNVTIANASLENGVITFDTGSFDSIIKDLNGTNVSILFNASNYNITIQNVRLENITGRPAIQINPGSYDIAINKVNINGVTGTGIHGLFIENSSKIVIENSNFTTYAPWASYKSGVYLFNINKSKIDKVIVSKNWYGILLNNSNDINISDTFSSQNYNGIVLFNADNNKLKNIYGGSYDCNLDPGDHGLAVNLISSSNNTIDNIRFPLCAINPSLPYANQLDPISGLYTSTDIIWDPGILRLLDSHDNNISDIEALSKQRDSGFAHVIIQSSHRNMLTNIDGGKIRYLIYVSDSNFNKFLNINSRMIHTYGTMYLRNSSNNTVTNIKCSDECQILIYLDQSSNNNITEAYAPSCMDEPFFIRFQNSSHNKLSKVTSGEYCGFRLEGSKFNEISNVILSTSRFGISLNNSAHNKFTNTQITLCPRYYPPYWYGGEYGILLLSSSNNTIINSSITLSKRWDCVDTETHTHINSTSSSTNNILLNTSFDRSKIHVDGTSNLTVQWYLDIPIRYPNGTIITGLNRSIVNIERTDWANIITNETISNITEAIVSDAGGIYITSAAYKDYIANISIVGLGPTWNATKKIVLNESKTITLTGAGNVTQNITLENDLFCIGGCFNFTAPNVKFDGGNNTIKSAGGSIGAHVIASNVNISNLNIEGFAEGLRLSGRNATLRNISISNSSQYNLWFDVLEGHDIDTSNKVDGKSVYYMKNEMDKEYNATHNPGLFACFDCENVTLKDANISKVSHGVALVRTNDSKVENVNSSGEFGIYLYDSDDNKVINSIANATRRGISLHDGSENNKIINLTAITTGSPDEEQAGIYILYSSNNEISNADVSGYYGIKIYGADRNSINMVNILSCPGAGVRMDTSNYNSLKDIVAKGCGYKGVELFSSSYNELSHINVSDNEEYGILLADSSNNNSIINSVVSGKDSGIVVSGSSQNRIINSSADGYNGISLDSSHYNQIINSSVRGAHGIYLHFSSNNQIINSSASGHYNGIFLETSSYNQIIYSTIKDSARGIYLYESDGNIISKNNIYNNTMGIHSDFPATLSDSHYGNFWGRTSWPYFCTPSLVDAGKCDRADSNADDVIDPYPFRSASGWEVESRALIPVAGGAIRSTDQRVDVIVPAGAFLSDTVLLIARTNNSTITTSRTIEGILAGYEAGPYELIYNNVSVPTRGLPLSMVLRYG